jgi:restriction system protein
MPNEEIPPKEMTPEEMMDAGYAVMQEKLKDELLATVKKSTPRFFEKLVVDLIVSMGYGGSIKEAGKAIGMSGDEGIDGIIKEDLLGLDAIYIQAKKWEGSVGRPEIQKFAGALQGQRARKGIFITTSSFSQDANDFVSKIDSKIILIDGKRLAEYMIEHGVGVSSDRSFIIKKINSDYFEPTID